MLNNSLSLKEMINGFSFFCYRLFLNLIWRKQCIYEYLLLYCYFISCTKYSFLMFRLRKLSEPITVNLFFYRNPNTVVYWIIIWALRKPLFFFLNKIKHFSSKNFWIFEWLFLYRKGRHLVGKCSYYLDRVEGN